jgi:hypothetical protein
MAQAADFFVSYTSADRASAEWFAWQLGQSNTRLLQTRPMHVPPIATRPFG